MATGGYAGKLLRVDLSRETIKEEIIEEGVLREYLGGTGLGVKYLYEEVPPGVEWNDPANRLIVFSGPLGGTSLGGSGTISVVTKGPLTNGATSTQANGFLGAYLKFCGYDGLIVQGSAKKLVYLHIQDGKAELRDAAHLAGKDTWESEDLIKEELGKREREMSVFSIGPAGENLVRFAGIVGDRGHSASHNGSGAVMGSKKLKAIAVARGKGGVKLADKESFSRLAREMTQKVTSIPDATSTWGTLGNSARAKSRVWMGTLPVKNYTTTLFDEPERMSGELVRPLFKTKLHPCWACQFHHCHIFELTEGPHKGFIGEEPEYEQMASWSSLIGQTDPIEAVVLSNDVDRLGLETNEAGWLVAWLMECYEKGLLKAHDLDGIEMTWGNPASARTMLNKIARREGIGDALAEGVMRCAQRQGEPATSMAIYTKKGTPPRTHDHRSSWTMALDTAASDVATDEDGAMIVRPAEVGLPVDADLLTPEVAPVLVARTRGKVPFQDSLGMCLFNNWGASMDFLADLVSAATGWEYTGEDALRLGRRTVNLLRAFNIRHGLTADLDAPSARYGSAPSDGPFAGKTMLPHWDEMLGRYYVEMGWDKAEGKPLPETLKSLGLDYVVPHIW